MARRHAMRERDWESLFTRLEELVLSNSGEDPFEEIFKLLIAKLWDEQHNQGRTFALTHDSTAARITIDQLLRDAEAHWPGLIPPPAHSRLVDAHLAVCVSAFAHHQLSETSFEVMDGAFEFLVSRAAKGAKGQYFTPRHVVDFCVRMLQPRRGELLCDPACGSGGFLVHAMHHVLGPGPVDPAASARYCQSALWGFDFDARAVRVAQALMLFAGSGRANLHRLNSLWSPLAAQRDPASASVTIEKLMRSRLKGFKGFDVILTNPPFAGEIREKDLLASYSLYQPGRRLERDVLFLERCVQLLKPGGRMAIILPHNKLGAAAWSYLREWLLRELQLVAVIGLGRHTFLPHTHQKAGVLIGVRRPRPLRRVPAEDVFFAVSERDGKDSRGHYAMLPGVAQDQPLWSRCDHDLSEIHQEFSRFCLRQGIGWGANGANLR